MYFPEAVEIIEKLEPITGFSEEPLAIKAAAIMLWCIKNENWDPDDIVLFSGHSKDEVAMILINLIEKGYLVGNELVMEEPENNETNWVEFLTIALKAAGVIQTGLN